MTILHVSCIVHFVSNLKRAVSDTLNDLFFGNGFWKIEALKSSAAGFFKELALLFRLYAFAESIDSEIFSHVEDAVEDYEFRCSTTDVEHDYLFSEREEMQNAQVAHLMKNLTRRQRQAITLYYLEQRKYEEICKIMQMNYHSVRNLMHRGMLKLREAAM